MPAAIRALKRGQSIQLTYRRRIIGTLQPHSPASKPLRRGSSEAILQALQSIQDLAIPAVTQQDQRSYKEQLAELRDKKYGI